MAIKHTHTLHAIEEVAKDIEIGVYHPKTTEYSFLNSCGSTDEKPTLWDQTINIFKEQGKVPSYDIISNSYVVSLLKEFDEKPQNLSGKSNRYELS